MRVNQSKPLPRSELQVWVDRESYEGVGAEGCRVSLLRWIAGTPRLLLVHRLENAPHHDGYSLRWDIDRIVSGVQHGLRLAAGEAPEGIRSIAVDGRTVDYVRLGPNGTAIENPFCYRDLRTVIAEGSLHEPISAERMKKLTAIQTMRINTLYQLYADRLEGLRPGQWLNLPEYLLNRLGGKEVSEQSNASHTQMIDVTSSQWSHEILSAADLDPGSFPVLVPAGTVLGKLKGKLADISGLSDTFLIAPACHDTASAIAGIPDAGNNWAYISSVTWSLVGTLIESPVITEAATDDGFTNLAASGGSLCFHVNVNGMWMLSQCMREWKAEGKDWNVEDLVEAAEARTDSPDLIDVDDPS